MIVKNDLTIRTDYHSFKRYNFNQASARTEENEQVTHVVTDDFLCIAKQANLHDQLFQVSQDNNAQTPTPPSPS